MFSRFLQCIPNACNSLTMKTFVREIISANGIRIKIYDENADPLTCFIAETTECCRHHHHHHQFNGIWLCFRFCGDSGGVGEDILSFSFSDSFVSYLPKSCAVTHRQSVYKNKSKWWKISEMKHATECNAVKTSKNYDDNNKISHLLQHNSPRTSKRIKKNKTRNTRENATFFRRNHFSWSFGCN